MTDITPNEACNASEGSSDDEYSNVEELLVAGMLCEAAELIRNRKRLRFPSLSVSRKVINPGGPAAAEEKAQLLLKGSNRQFHDELRVTKEEFSQLYQWISNNTHMKGSCRQTLQLKLMIFLYVIGQGCTQRAVAYRFGVAQSSVSRIMKTAFEAFLDIHRTYVVQPEPDYMCHEPITKPRSEYFFGCIGAVDGTHIGAWIPEAHQRKWYNRKSLITQNVLCAVRLDGTFSYVLAGCEGSVNDASLMRHACDKSLKMYSQRFYVGDAGFGSRVGLLVPYISVRYHLNDWKVSLEGPQNKEELYNLRHSRLRIIVEQTFGQVKRKFHIMRSSPPEYSIYKQVLIVYACTGLWNFLKSLKSGPRLRRDDREYLEQMRTWAGVNLPRDPGTLRTQIATDQWEEHLEYKEEMEAYNKAIHGVNNKYFDAEIKWLLARPYRDEGGRC